MYYSMAKASFLRFQYGIDFSTRTFLNAKNDEHVDMLKLVKGLQDDMSHSYVSKGTQDILVTYLKRKQGLLDDFKELEVANANLQEVLPLRTSYVLCAFHIIRIPPC